MCLKAVRLKGFFEAAFMVKNQTESSLQGGDFEESYSIFRGLNVKS